MPAQSFDLRYICTKIKLARFDRCEICTYVTTDPEEFKDHERYGHEGEDPYEENEKLDISFDDPEDGYEPDVYTCEECGRNFENKKNMILTTTAVRQTGCYSPKFRWFENKL